MRYTDKCIAETEYNFAHRVIEDIGIVRALRKAGWSIKKLAQEFKCTEERMAQVMRKEGIK